MLPRVRLSASRISRVACPPTPIRLFSCFLRSCDMHDAAFPDDADRLLNFEGLNSGGRRRGWGWSVSATAPSNFPGSRCVMSSDCAVGRKPQAHAPPSETEPHYDDDDDDGMRSGSSSASASAVTRTGADTCTGYELESARLAASSAIVLELPPDGTAEGEFAGGVGPSARPTTWA